MAKNYIDRDKIMNKDEFYKLPKADRRALMAHWRLVFDTEQIKKELGISTTAFYALLKRLDLPTNLKEHRDTQPSLLGEEVVNTNKQQSVSSEPTTNPPLSLKCEVDLVGVVGVYELPDVVSFANAHGLEITIKSQS